MINDDDDPTGIASDFFGFGFRLVGEAMLSNHHGFDEDDDEG